MHPQAPLKFCYQALTKKGASYYRWWVIATVLLTLAAFIGVTVFETAEWLLFLIFGLAGMAMIVATLRLLLVKLFEENADAINLFSSYFPSLVGTRSLELACKITNAVYYGVFYFCCYFLLAAIFLFPLSLVVEYAKS
jgi:hypothetical protein